MSKQIVGMVAASLRGKEIKESYRAVLVSQDGKPVIRIEQPFLDGDEVKWVLTPGGWLLETLRESSRDRIAIDLGAEWYVERGMLDVIRNAELFAAQAA